MGTPPGTPPGPPPPRFSDVLDAQRWAAKVVQQAEETAARRGRRGSQAWEDAWRDALWTLAVQKRCVEVEARRQASSVLPPTPVLPQPPQGHSAINPPELLAAPKAGPPAVGPPRPAVAILESSAAEAALQQGAELFEKRCLEPVHKRLDGMEESLCRLQLGLSQALSRTSKDQASRGQRPDQAPNSREGARMSSEATMPAAYNSLTTAGPLPVDARGTAALSAAAIHEQQATLLDLRQQLAAAVERGEAEAKRRSEVEQQRSAAEHRLRLCEAEQMEIRQQLRQEETRAQQEVLLREEAEEAWQRRHASLQRQLQRTELILGGAERLIGHQASPRNTASDTAEGNPEDAGAWHRPPPRPQAISEDLEREALGSTAILKLLREVRELDHTGLRNGTPRSDRDLPPQASQRGNRTARRPDSEQSLVEDRI